MPGGDGACPRLGLGTVEIPLAPETAAADGQQAPGLLPTGVLYIVTMVEDHQKAVQHILFGVRHQIKNYDAADSCSHCAEKQSKPPQGKARHEGHHHEDQHEHEGIAHVAGNDEVQPRQPQGMARRHQGGREGFQVPLLLPEPLQLPGQQDDEGDLHHLRRTDAHRQKRKFQPRPVAVLLNAERRPQQEDKQHVERRDPLPPLDEHFQVDHGDGEVHHNADQQRRRLDDDLPVVRRSIIAGSTVYHGNAEYRCSAAKPQQDQIRLLDDLQ